MPAVDKDGCFAVAGGSTMAGELHAFDACSGEHVWHTELANAGIEGSPIVTAGTVAVVIRGARGVKLRAFERGSGELRWESAHGFPPLWRFLSMM